MRFGINTFLFTSPFTNKSTRLFPKFKRWGFEAVEIPVEDPSHIDPAFVKRELDRHGLVCCAITGCMGPGRDLRGTAAEQRTALDYLRALIDQLEALDCPKLTGPLFSVTGKADALEPAQKKREWALVVKNLKALAKHAERRGRQICIEPLNRFETDFLNTTDQTIQLLKDIGSPAMRIHLDTFHLNIEEKFLDAAIRKAGPLLAHLHACGSDRGTPGGDHTDWKSIAAALKAIRYRGDVVIESFTTDVKLIARAAAIWRKIEPTRDEIAVKGLKFLKKLMK